MRAYWLYIILIILTVAATACGVQPAQGLAETTAVTSPPATTVSDEPVLLLWEGPALFAEDQTECHRLRLTDDNQAFLSQCDGEQTEVEFVPNQNGGLVEMMARLAPFQADTAQGRVAFKGRGEIAGPAWERAIASWAQFTYAELASGRVGAANRTVLAWNLGEQNGQCQMLLVLSHGYATAGLTPCEGGQMEVIASGWVDTAEWEQLDAWLYNRAPVYQDSSYLDGRGTTEMSAEEVAALSKWSRSVYDKVRKTAGIAIQPIPTTELASATTAADQTSLFPITDETGQYGFVNQTGQVVVEPRYDYADRLIEGRAMIQRGDKWGFLDETGQEIIPPQYDSVNPYTEGLAAVMHNGGWGVIDRSGQMVIEPTFAAPLIFRDGLAHLAAFGKFGLMDTGGQIIVEPAYNWLDEFHQNRAIVQVEDKYGYLEPGGQMVIEPQFDEAGRFPLVSEPSPVVLAPVPIGEKWGYIDNAGQMVIKPQFAYAGPFSSSLAVAINNFDDSRFGYIDSTGHYVIEPQFEAAFEFSERLAAVSKDGKFGYIDTTGQFVIAPQFDGADAFSEGLASVSILEDQVYRQGYIDRTGQIIIEPTLDGAFSFKEGLALAALGLAEGYKYGYLKPDGQWLVEPTYDAASHFSEQRAAVMRDGKWGYIDPTGDEDISLQFDEAGAFSDNGLAPVRLNGKAGYINRRGEIVIPAQFDSAFAFDAGLARVVGGSQDVYVDTGGQILFETPGLYGSDFREGLAQVQIGNKYYFSSSLRPAASHSPVVITPNVGNSTTPWSDRPAIS